MPDFQQYMALVTSTSLPNTFSSQDPRLYTSTLWMNLREHHCINPEHPVRAGGTHIEYDDGVGNAYFPAVTFREVAGRVRVEDEALNRISRYETWVEGRPNSHSPETCTQCRHSKETQEGELRQRVRAITAAAEIDSEREGGLDIEEDKRTTTQRPQPTAGFAAQSQRSSPGPSGVRTSAENVQLTHAWAAATAALGRDVDVFLEDMMLEDDEDSDEEDESGGSGDDESEQKQQHEYAESVDGGEEGEEVIVNTCNGVCDIIVTGEVRLSDCRHTATAYPLSFSHSLSPSDPPAPRPGVEPLPFLRACAAVGWFDCALACARGGPESGCVHLPGLPRRELEFRGLVAAQNGQPANDFAGGPVCGQPGWIMEHEAGLASV